MKDFKFIDITDLPSDPQGSLGKLRTDLLRAYNFNRNHAEKMELIASTLLFILSNINAGLETPDAKEVEDYMAYHRQKEIDSAVTTSGFFPKAAVKKVAPKPKTKRAAKRTTPKKDK